MEINFEGQSELIEPDDSYEQGYQTGKYKKAAEIIEIQTAERVALILA